MNTNRLKNKKIDNYLVLSLIFIIISLFITLMPQSPCSIMKILGECKQLIQTYQTINANKTSIEQQNNTLTNLQAQSQQYLQKKIELEQKLNNMDLKLHMPSILILLEQKAKYFGLDLKIAYGQIKELSTPQPPSNQKNTGNKENKTASQNESKNSSGNNNQQATTAQSPPAQQASTPQPSQQVSASNLDTSSQTVTSNQTENKEQNSEEVLKKQIDKVMNTIVGNPVSIGNISTTIIPIQVKGNYASVRNYLNFLDQIDYIEPTYIEMTSSGQEIDALIMLYVFHSEVKN